MLQLIPRICILQTRIMCILFVHTNQELQGGKYQLIIATNRDEHFLRPACAAHRWQEDDKIIGGKDLLPGREGGTWFGISLRQTSQFKFRAAALLNVSGEPREIHAPGRGSIVSDYLRGDLTGEEYVTKKLKPVTTNLNYNAFIFVAVEIGNSTPRVIHYSNVTDSLVVYSNSDKFFNGFGNSLLHEPLTKVLVGIEKFASDVSAHNETVQRDLLVEKLMGLLKWEKKHLPDPVLQRRTPGKEEHLCQIFVNTDKDDYGTRTHTIVLVDTDGNVDFLEHTLIEHKWLKNEFKAKLY